MLPLAFLLPALGSTAVRVLVSGSPPDAGAWGSFTEKLLGVLVVEQSRTSCDLARIEAKLDQLSVQVAVQPYVTAMRSGGMLLEQAQRGWRSPSDRELLLHEARMQYVHAASSAPDEATGSTPRSIWR